MSKHSDRTFVYSCALECEKMWYHHLVNPAWSESVKRVQLLWTSVTVRGMYRNGSKGMEAKPKMARVPRPRDSRLSPTQDDIDVDWLEAGCNWTWPCVCLWHLWLRASHCTDYHVTSLLFLRVTCPCSLRTYATLKSIRSSSSSSFDRSLTACVVHCRVFLSMSRTAERRSRTGRWSAASLSSQRQSWPLRRLSWRQLLQQPWTLIASSTSARATDISNRSANSGQQVT